MPASAIELIAAPSSLGLSRPDGRVPRVDLLPQALLDAGLGQGLQFVAAQPVRVPAYVPLRDPATGVHNGPGIAAVAHELADRVQAARAASRFALVLGGDCSILLGALLGVRRNHRVGLVFVDGHTDFWPPEASPLGGVAGMDLWFATGRGPDLLANLEGLRPLVRDEDVAVLGFRDPDDWTLPAGAAHARDTAMLVKDLAALRRAGAALQ